MKIACLRSEFIEVTVLYVFMQEDKEMLYGISNVLLSLVHQEMRPSQW
jgi:hypothetical protein